MSCKHGNWSPCDECDAEEAISDEAYQRGKKDGWEACEACHGIVDGKVSAAAELRTKLAAKDKALGEAKDRLEEFHSSLKGFFGAEYLAAKVVPILLAIKEATRD